MTPPIAPGTISDPDLCTLPPDRCDRLHSGPRRAGDEAGPAAPDPFSLACPACGGSRFGIRTQRNNLTGPGLAHDSTTRFYACWGCDHAWSERRPPLR